MADPDYIYDPEDWEATFMWNDRGILADHLEIHHRRGEVVRLATLVCGPDKFVANIVLSRDADGDPIDEEIRWFDSEEEARAALAKAEAPSLAERITAPR